MDKAAPKFLVYCLNVALVLALCVLMLGAYTRLTHAGLGCPDWPLCYGQAVVAHQEAGQNAMQQRFPDNRLFPEKAWTEMVHRYFAGSLAVLVFVIALGLIGQRLKVGISLLLIAMLIGQALLGMWTVTLKLLPIVVMGHLLGGILIFSLLCALRVQLSHLEPIHMQGRRRVICWISLGLLLLFCQIGLGGWVSANYAGIACMGFPTCNGQWFPVWHFSEGFHLFSPVGANYQGGVLDAASRMTIQVVHRMGAVIAGGYIVWLSLFLVIKLKKSTVRRLAWLIFSLVIIQWCLGIMNVIYWLPLPVAVAHNGVAALLMASMSMLLVAFRRTHEPKQ